MATSDKPPVALKWNTRQRLQFIEVMAFYTGVVTRSEVARAFGISDAAATKDLKYYSELAPDNLVYRHTVFGFVPGDDFQPLFADLDPAAVLPMIAANLATSGGPADDQPLYGVAVDTLPLPVRLPTKEVLAPIIRAIKQQKKIRVRYKSLTERHEGQERLIEPHALIDTGLRWHVRAYSHDTYDFRDFVLSRFIAADMLDDAAESSAIYDDDWTEVLTLKLSPHPDLSAQQRDSLCVDYNAVDEVIELTVRRALVGYLLHRLSVDTTTDHSMNPNVYQLIVVNRDEIEPFAGWAFL
jgi:predicted DNA-binding transcriptional regulator YafY